MGHTHIANTVRNAARHASDQSRKRWWSVKGTQILTMQGMGRIGVRLSPEGSNMLWSMCVLAFYGTQLSVSTSSTEAEYVRVGSCVKEALFIRLSVREDNEGAIRFTNNPLSSARPRHHIDARHDILHLWGTGCKARH